MLKTSHKSLLGCRLCAWILCLASFTAVCAVPVSLPAAREPAPTADEEKAVRKEVRSLFSREFASRDPDARRELASSLIESAIETTRKPLLGYGFLVEARDLAAAEGDVEVALLSCDELAKRFEVDRLEMRVQQLLVLNRSVKARKDREERAKAELDLVRESLETTDEALKAIRPELAEKPLKIATQRGRAASEWLTYLAQRRAGWLKKLEKNQRDLERALLVLDSGSQADWAHVLLGEYLFATLEDVEAGLDHIARGRKSELRTLARRDLRPPESKAGQRQLADRWWASAARAKDELRDAESLRAQHWYAQIWSSIGLLEKRQIDETLSGSPRRFLANMPELDVKLRYGELGKNGSRGTGREDDQRDRRGRSHVEVNGLKPERSLAMVAGGDRGDATVKYRLGGRYSAFETHVAVDDAGGWGGEDWGDGRGGGRGGGGRGGGSGRGGGGGRRTLDGGDVFGIVQSRDAAVSRPVFVVIGDGRELWSSRPIESGKPQSCRVRVKGVETLELLVRVPGRASFAMAIWIDPVLKN